MRNILYLGLCIIAIIVMATLLPPLLGNSDPNSPYQQALQREQIARDKNWTLFIERASNLLLFILAAVAILLLVAAGIAMYLAYQRAMPQHNRQIDGSFALQRRNITITDPVTGQRKRTTAIINPNHIIDPVAYWNPFTNQLETGRGAHTIDAQERLAHARLATSRIQAAIPGDAAHIAHARAAAGARNVTFRPPPAPPAWIDRMRPPELPAPTQPAQPPPPALPLSSPDWRHAYDHSTAKQWIVGYSGNGAECYFDLDEDTHCGIIGATGTGKTASLTFLLIALALKNNYQVLILDGKGGADLSLFQRHTKYVAVEGIEYAHQIAELHADFQHRRGLLNAAQCHNIDEYNAATGANLPRRLIVNEEFGRIWESIPTRGRQSTVMTQLDDLMAMSRFVGFHFVFVDQRPKRWPDQILTNCKAKYTFKLDSRQANVVNAYDAANLPTRGAFLRDNTQYNAWDMSQNIRPLLATMPALSAAPPRPQPQPPTVNQTTTSSSNTAAFVDDDPRRFLPIIAAYFAADKTRYLASPMSGASHVADEMARQVNDGRTKEHFKGLAGTMLARARLEAQTAPD